MKRAAIIVFALLLAVAAAMVARRTLGVSSWPFLTRRTATPAPFDWPQWRGPHRDDTSRETGLLKEWPADGPKRLWLSREIGRGYSAPSIAAGRLFTAGDLKDAEYLFCLDALTGKKLWSTAIGAARRDDHGSGPRGTPSVDGDRVYMLGAQGDLVCAAATNGKILWRGALSEVQGKTPRWGYSESVLVDGPNVICTPGASTGTIAAFDKITGKTLWQSGEITDPAHYSSIAPLEVNGQRQLVQLTKQHVFAVSPADGKLLWQQPYPGYTVIPSPVVRSPYVYLSSGFAVGCMLLKIGPGNAVEKVYQNKFMKNQSGGVVLLGDYLYGYSDGFGWICQNFLTGALVWSEKKALGTGSLTSADGLLYCLDESGGDVVLVQATPERWHEISRFKLVPQSTQRETDARIYAHPVLANGLLYLRDQELQFCFDLHAAP